MSSCGASTVNATTNATRTASQDPEDRTCSDCAAFPRYPRDENGLPDQRGPYLQRSGPEAVGLVVRVAYHA